MALQDILGRYADAKRAPPPPDIQNDFDMVAHEAAPDALQDGIAEAFRSDATPPFEAMVGQLFEHSEPRVRAGLLDNLLAGLGPASLGAAAGGGLADIWRRYAAGARVAPERAAQVDPLEVQEVARQARIQNPGVLERVSRFYARHPELVRSLGNVAMGIALSKIARRNHH
jgi:hypothetical protein